MPVKESRGFHPDDISDEFWDIVDKAQKDRSRLREILRGVNRGTLIRFCWAFDEARVALSEPPHSSYLDPELSEDGVDDVCSWQVAQGKDAYYEVWDNPELMPSRMPEKSPASGFLSQAYDEYRERYGKVVPYREDLYS